MAGSSEILKEGHLCLARALFEKADFTLIFGAAFQGPVTEAAFTSI